MSEVQKLTVRGQWHQAHPHRFHMLALGTLHSLPSPVQRRGQKPYKPIFFENLRREREAEDGLRDVQEWLMHVGRPSVLRACCSHAQSLLRTWRRVEARGAGGTLRSG